MKQNKVIYAQPIRAEYQYEVMTLDRKFVCYKAIVSVVERTENSFKVVLHEPIRNHCVGDIIWVRKRHIRLGQQVVAPATKVLSNQFPFTTMPTVDCTDAWWNNN